MSNISTEVRTHVIRFVDKNRDEIYLTSSQADAVTERWKADVPITLGFMPGSPTIKPWEIAFVEPRPQQDLDAYKRRVYVYVKDYFLGWGIKDDEEGYMEKIQRIESPSEEVVETYYTFKSKGKMETRIHKEFVERYRNAYLQKQHDESQ